jgi:hypothetical protein
MREVQKWTVSAGYSVEMERVFRQLKGDNFDVVKLP